MYLNICIVYCTIQHQQQLWPVNYVRADWRTTLWPVNSVLLRFHVFLGHNIFNTTLSNTSNISFPVFQVINGKDPVVKNDYISEANDMYKDLPPIAEKIPSPTRTEKKKLVEHSIEVYSNVQQEMANEKQREKQRREGENSKRKNCRLSSEERRQFMEIYKMNHGKLDDEAMARIFKVTPKYITYLRRQIKQGKSIELSSTRRGNKMIANKEDLQHLRDAMEQHASWTDKMLADDLTSFMHLNKPISRRTINRYRTGGALVNAGLGLWTCKKGSYRSEKAFTDDNQEARKKAIEDVFAAELEGYLIVYIDETSWEIGRSMYYAKAPSGEKAFVPFIPKGFRMTSIAAISKEGPKYTSLFVDTSVNAELFKAYMEELISRMGNRQCVFFMDNAPIHIKNELLPLILNKNHKIIFNAPYSEEANPIEMFFGVWKHQVDQYAPNNPTKAEMVQFIADKFYEIDIQTCVDMISKVNTVIAKKIESGDQI